MFLGFDFGTSGARACIIDNDKAIIWTQRVAYPVPAEQTPLIWRAALNTLLTGLPKDCATRLQGIAINGTSASVLLADAKLEPTSPALLYHDDCAHQRAKQLNAITPDDHLVCTSNSGLAKFLWLTQQANDTQTSYFLHQADWLTALLSGQPGISDYHNALKTGYDLEHLRWPDWVTSLPNAHLLPQVVAPGAIIGTIQSDIATHFDINPKCLIHAGTTDSTAAFIASGVTQIGIGVTSLGSTLVLKQLSKHRIDAPEYGVYSHRYGDLWLVGGASNCGASVLKRFFSDAQLTTLSAQINPLQTSPLDYYPLSKTGERFPINDAQLTPKLEPRPKSDVEFLHGLLQGLTQVEVAGYKKLAELGAPTLEHVISNGGGAKNEVWKMMRQTLLEVPVDTAAHAEAAYGTALLSHNGQTNTIRLTD